MARHFQEVLPDSTLVRLEHSGHWPFLEEPDQFQAALLAFLSHSK
jgi:pimeloyl-ACP methyl ester carboxylesterase